MGFYARFILNHKIDSFMGNDILELKILNILVIFLEHMMIE